VCVCVCEHKTAVHIVVPSHARTSDNNNNNNINKPPFIPVAEVPSYRPTDGHIHYSFVYYTHTLVLPIYSIIIIIRLRYVHDMWQRYIYSHNTRRAAEMSDATPHLAIAGACSNRLECNKFNNYHRIVYTTLGRIQFGKCVFSNPCAK